jgi:hypothetical protein
MERTRLASLAILCGVVGCNDPPEPVIEERHCGLLMASSGSSGLPGERGTTPIYVSSGGEGIWWREWAGVAPETPDGHTAYQNEDCSEREPVEFGEYCEGGLLVESNPDAGVCHPHESGQGNPYVFNCNEYCQGTGRASGECVAANAVSPYSGQVVSSAKCQCTNFHTPRTGTDVRLDF